MLEFVFFSEKFRRQFGEFLKTQDVSFISSSDSIEDTLLLSIEEPEDAVLWDLIDDKFDELKELDQAGIEQDLDDISGAGIYNSLSNGEPGGNESNAFCC